MIACKEPVLKLRNRSKQTYLPNNPVFHFVVRLVNWRHKCIELFKGRYGDSTLRSCAHLIKMMEDVPNRNDYASAKFFINNTTHIFNLMPGASAKNFSAFDRALKEAHEWSIGVLKENLVRNGYTNGG